MLCAPLKATMPTRMRVVEANQRRDETHREVPVRRSRPLLIAVDDDVATLDLLCEIAAEAGWFAMGFTRLAQLRASLDHERPSLLIIDDDLPDGRGGDLARELREDPRMTDVPLLVCTAAHPVRQAEIGSWAPVISKPFDLGDIETVLDAAAGQRRGNDGHKSFNQAG
jgi:DNA-binding response OmpR family regulator